MNEEGGFKYNWDMVKVLFGNNHHLSLWAPALSLAVILRTITTKFHHQLIFPICEPLLLSCIRSPVIDADRPRLPLDPNRFLRRRPRGAF